MAFCEITKNNVSSITQFVFTKINEDPSKVKDFKSFSAEVFQDFIDMNASVEKAVTLLSYLPDIISQYRTNTENRKLLKEAKVSMDMIDEVEEIFKEYKKLAEYVGVKNEIKPLIVVNQKQLDVEKKIDELIAKTQVEMEGSVRKVNNDIYDIRVTNIAKVGYDDSDASDEGTDSHPLKHGRTIDVMGKDIFDGILPKYEDYKDTMDKDAFDSAVGILREFKKQLEEEGYIFRTGVTVYNKKLGIAGEIDLLAISPEGEVYILDYKTSAARFNDAYLQNAELTIKSENIIYKLGTLSKWQQYVTQGYLYGLLLKEQLGLPIMDKVGILGMSIQYDLLEPTETSKIQKMGKAKLFEINHNDIRQEFKDKTLEELRDLYLELRETSLGEMREVSPVKPEDTKRKIVPVDELPERSDKLSKRKLDRLKVLGEIAATDTELQKEYDWYMSTPLGQEMLLKIDSMVNTGLFGKFQLDGITIYKNASKGTVYHEGWHLFSQVFMTKGEKNKLYETVKKDNVKFKTRDGRIINSRDASYLDIEEFLAEEFAKYGLAPKEYKYPTSNSAPKSFFQKIWDFLVRYFGKNPRPMELFQKLYTGKINHYKPSKSNAYWGNLNSVITNSKGKDIISPERLPLYIESFDSLIADELNAHKKSTTAFRQSKSLQADVIHNVYSELDSMFRSGTLNTQQVGEFHSILENRYEFTRILLDNTAYDSLRGMALDKDVFTMNDEELTSLQELEETYGDIDSYDGAEAASKPERFDRTGNQDKAVDLLSDSVRDSFRTIPIIESTNEDGSFVFEKNELGITKRHTYYDIFHRAKKILSGTLEMSLIMEKMKDPDNRRLLPEIALIHDYINNFLQPDVDSNPERLMQNAMFVQGFTKIMSMPELRNVQAVLDYDALAKSRKGLERFLAQINKVSRSLSLKIMSVWDKNLRESRGKEFFEFKGVVSDDVFASYYYKGKHGRILFNPFINYDTDFKSSTIEGLKGFYEVLGITLNNKVYEDAPSVARLREIKKKITANLTLYRNAKAEELEDEVKEILKKRGETSTDGSILEQLTPKEADDIISKYFISSLQQQFKYSNIYHVTEESYGKFKTVKKQSDGLYFTFEEIADMEEKFGERVSSGAFRIEDKTKYPYYIQNQLTIITGLLNEVKHIDDFKKQIYLTHLDPNIYSWIKKSVFFNQMFDSSGKRALDENGHPVTIEIGEIASVKIKKHGEIKEYHPKSLNENEKFFLDVISLFKGGLLEIQRAETSSSIFTLRLTAYNKDSKNLLPVPPSQVSGAKIPEVFHTMVKDYFLAEIAKRQWFLANDKNIVGVRKYTKGKNKGKAIPLSEQFNIFEDILSAELKAKIVENLEMRPEDILNEGTILADFRKEVEEHFKGRGAEMQHRFEVSNTSEQGLTKEQFEILKDTLKRPGSAATLGSAQSMSLAYVLNHFILAQEFYTLYMGDMYYYKNPFKRGKFVTNTGTPYYIDDVRNAMLNNIKGASMSDIYHGRTQSYKDFRKFTTGIINDVEMDSPYLGNNAKESILVNDIINNRIHAGLFKKGSAEHKAQLSAVWEQLQKYKKINIADGQGIISLDFYRNFSIITEIWSPEKDQEYNRQKAILRNHFNLYFKLDDKGAKVSLEGQELADAIKADKELIAIPGKGILNPLKISYTGPSVKKGPFAPVFDKFSVRPIIPEVAIGKRDEALLLKMIEGDIDYLKFSSGTKVFQENSFSWFKQLSEGKYDATDFSVSEDIASNELYSAFLKHQLSTEGHKSENILGSQFRKIVFGIKYSPLVRNNKELSKYFEKLEGEFFDSINELLKVEQGDLFSLLGIEDDNGSYRVDDMKKFLQLLHDESVKRGVPINDIQYLQYDEVTKNAKYPIEYAFNRQQIQDLLSGLIDNRLRRLKINGSSLIQVSIAGFENKSSAFSKPTDAQIKEYGQSGLHYYHTVLDRKGNPTTSTMGVKVALLGDYKHLLNLEAPDSLGVSNISNKEGKLIFDKKGNPVMSAGKIGTLARLNEAMKDKAWKKRHMDKFILVGYRIPTQNNNFIDHMEIMEFLPPVAGAIIIGPMELIIKSGSDFDIDKMNIIRPAFNREGNIVGKPVESLEEILAAIKKITYSERELNKIKKDLANLKSTTGDRIEKLLEIQAKIRYTIIDLAMKSQVSTSIIDTIMDNIANNERVVLPEKSLSEDKSFSDEEITDYNVKYYDALLDFADIDVQINDLKENIKTTTKETAEDGKFLDIKWFKKKQEYKNAQHNRMMGVLKETLSHPYYLELLVTPATTSTLDAITNELIASQRNMSQEDYDEQVIKAKENLFDSTRTPEENTRYSAWLESFRNLLSKRKDLGGYAIQRTFVDMFNFVKFSIAAEYPVKFRREEVMKKNFIPLIPPKDRSKVMKNGRILMHGDSVTGIAIKQAFDEFISLTVDLANSPAYPWLNISNYNRKYIQYLLHQKVDTKVAVWFINQPILRELFALYEVKRKSIKDYTLKHAITELALRKNILSNPPMYPNSKKPLYEVIQHKYIPAEYDGMGEKIEGTGVRVEVKNQANISLSKPYIHLGEQNITEDDYFSLEDLDAGIRDNVTSSEFQKKVLAYFASITNEADLVAAVQFANNVDTNTYATMTSLVRNSETKQEIRASGLFDNSQLDMLEKESMIAPFDYTKKAVELYKNLFPRLYTEATINLFKSLIKDVFGMKNVEMERVSKIIENDYIEFMYKNFGTYKGVNLSDYFESKIINLDGVADHSFFTNKLFELKEKYPELANIPFVDALYEDVYFPPEEGVKETFGNKDNLEIRNTFFLRNPDNPTADRNKFTNNWRNLINFNPDLLELKEEYTEEQVLEISDFFHELVYYSLYQSGLTNTGNGMSDLIPFEHWTKFITSAFDTMKIETEKNKTLEPRLLILFAERVRQMNPKVNWSTKSVDIDITSLTNEQLDFYGVSDEEYQRIMEEEQGIISMPLYSYKNYYRGKDYRVTEDDLGLASAYFSMGKESLRGKIKEVTTTPTLPTSAPLEKGRYVHYAGDTYIILKQVREGLWQIYNPLKEGPRAKLSVAEKNLTGLQSMGKIIDYVGKEYLVTSKNEIIDLDKYKKVAWVKDSIHRVNVIQLANTQSPPNNPINPGNKNC